MKFSIITPSYNQGVFLAETIESVISQEGDFFIDYIIIDGGSSDNSADIIKQYDARLRSGGWPVKCQGITYSWCSEGDKGQTDALMKGFRMAKGDIFAWLNSDDTYLPGALQTAADFFRENPETGLMYGEAYYCDAEGAIIGCYRTEPFELEKLAYSNIICQPATFFQRHAFETVGTLDEKLHYSMDFDLWIRIGKRFTCRYIPKPLATYRLHDTSKSINPQSLVSNCEEGLAVAIKHFGWAPLTRIFTACSIQCSTRMPRFLARDRTAVNVSAVFCSLFRSLHLNRGFHRNDLKLLSGKNFRKLFKSRFEIMIGK